MQDSQEKRIWSGGELYDSYVGRWSRLVAQEFVVGLGIPPGADWLDLGCGTGNLTAAILAQANPHSVLGVDPSSDMLAVAQTRVQDPRVRFVVGNAHQIDTPDCSIDALVSGLVLNFIPDLTAAMSEMQRVIKPGGVLAAYVWDYADKMQLMRYFWDAVIELFPQDSANDEAKRSPICQPQRLEDLFKNVGLESVQVQNIDVPTPFRDFDEYWSPFLRGHFPAPRYAMSLGETNRAALREHIRAALPIQADGSIPLIARAWAIRGTRPTA